MFDRQQLYIIVAIFAVPTFSVAQEFPLFPMAEAPAPLFASPAQQPTRLIEIPAPPYQETAPVMEAGIPTTGATSTSLTHIPPPAPPATVAVPDQIHVNPTPAFTIPGLKYPTIDVTGFAQIDALYFDQDETSKENNGNFKNFAGFRRARLAAKGQIASNTGYYLEMDFAFPGRPNFMDVWVEQQQISGIGNVRIGQFRQPLSMEAMTSVRDLMFLERAIPFALIPFRQIGVMAFNTAFDDNATWAASVYRFPTDGYGNAYSEGGYGTSYRLTGIPLSDDYTHEVLHFGFGYSYNKFGHLPNGNHFFGFRAQPEVGYNVDQLGAGGFFGPILASTGNFLSATSDHIFNLEAAYARKSFLFQSEFFDVMVQDPVGDQNYTGAYAQAAYVLTGEHHKYNKKAGAFGRVVPKCNLGANGWGAWELAGRWSYIDLRDTPNAFSPGQPFPPVNGVSPSYLTDLTGGLNWYWNAYAKMQFNYIHAFQKTKGAPSPNSDTNIFAIRTQFDF